MNKIRRRFQFLESGICSLLAFSILFALACGMMQGARAIERRNCPPPRVSLSGPLQLDEFQLPAGQSPHNYPDYKGGALAENYMTPDESWTILLTDLSPEIRALYQMEGGERIRFMKVKYSFNQLEAVQMQINQAIMAQAPDLFIVIEQSSLTGNRQAKLPLKGAIRPAQIDVQKNKVVVQGDIELLEQSFAQCRTIPADMVEIQPILPKG